jgi:biopolymer transport protein ExbD
MAFGAFNHHRQKEAMADINVTPMVDVMLVLLVIFILSAPMSALRNMMEAEVQRDPTNQPTLEIDTNDEADYGVLAKVLATARNAQMQKIGFVKK